ncbi:MAG: DegQ family serine endoprotease [bacterium]
MLLWKSSNSTRRFLEIALLGLFFTGLGILIAASFNWSPSSHANAPQRSASQTSVQSHLLSNGESPFVAVAEKVKPAVVNIRARKVVKGKYHRYPFEFYFEDPFEDFFKFFRRSPKGDEQKEREWRSESRGSGVIIDQQGYILTNNHVVEGAEDVKVKLSNEREFEAEIVGTDRMTDVALLKVKKKGVIPADAVAELGDSDRIRVGDWAIAIGNPFGLDRTVTVGVISAKGRSQLHIFDTSGQERSPYFQDFIQTDASINFGNSGGPLINIKGEVIGINTAINTQGQGIGFAIPINVAKQIGQQLRESGKVVRGFLGIWFQPLDPDLIEAKGLDIEKGVLVTEVMKGGPAEEAGIEPGDVIVAFDGKEIESGSQFQFMVAGAKPGEVAELEVIRDGRHKTVRVKLGQREFEEIVQGETEGEEPWLGLEVENVNGSFARQYDIDEDAGVVVIKVKPGSPADDKGIRAGDVILEVNSEAIKDLKHYRRVAKKLKDRKKPILFLVKRGERATYYALRPEED